MEDPAFPSDTYAIKTQIIHHGLDPKDALILARPRSGEFTVRTEEILDLMEKHADELAIVLIGGVNFFTVSCSTFRRLRRQPGSMESRLVLISPTPSATCRFRCMTGTSTSRFGVPTNTSTPVRVRSQAPLSMSDTPLTRTCRVWRAGLATIRIRVFACNLEPEFIPVPSADGWQISNPPILSMAPLRASLAIFEDAGGMEPLQQKLIKLTNYIQFLLESEPDGQSKKQ